MSRGTTSSVGVCGSRDDGDVTEQVDIDVASREDLAEIVAIRNAVAATSIASFDTRPASVADQLPWFDRTVSTGPYRILVARRAGRVLGYASSGRYREHEAFVRTVEVGIGLHADSRGQGIGSRLYRVLFDYLAGQPVRRTEVERVRAETLVGQAGRVDEDRRLYAVLQSQLGEDAIDTALHVRL
jgi:phosphinothricin acetyltransferase